MKVARTLLMGEEIKLPLPEDSGLVVFIRSEDELWKQLLAWHNFPPLEEFTFQAYLDRFTLLICPKTASKKRFRRLKREIALGHFSYPIRVVRGFPAGGLAEMFQKDDFRSVFRQTLWRRACELAKSCERAFEFLRHHLKRCPFCGKESLELIDEVAELKSKLEQLPQDQRPSLIFGFLGLLLVCTSCKETLFRQPQRHFYRFPSEWFLETKFAGSDT